MPHRATECLARLQLLNEGQTKAHTHTDEDEERASESQQSLVPLPLPTRNLQPWTCNTGVRIFRSFPPFSSIC